MFGFITDIFSGMGLKTVTVAPFTPKGNITIAADFPTDAEVQNGWLYSAAADVTDNDATKTNTGQSFVEGQEIYWYDTGWVIMGDDRLWGDDGTDLSPVEARSVDIPTGQTYKVNGVAHTHAHVDTTGKQGGTTDEYYHMTAECSTKLNDWVRASNLDIDTGTEVVDSFVDTAHKAVRWDFMVSNSAGTAVRCGSINAVWDAAADTINDSDEYGVVEVGDTSGLTFTVTIAANAVTLSAVAASDNWAVKVQRYPIG